MKAAAANLDFERAAALRDRVRSCASGAAGPGRGSPTRDRRLGEVRAPGGAGATSSCASPSHARSGDAAVLRPRRDRAVRRHRPRLADRRLLTGMFTGMVLALQSGHHARSVRRALGVVGRLVSASMVKELGPVLTGADGDRPRRLGHRRRARLDDGDRSDRALRALGTDPVRKLVVPRVLAGAVMVPVLTIISNAVGMVGGWIITVSQLRVASSVYWNSVVEGLYIQDVWMGLIKPFFLGFAIVSIGCHVGLRTRAGRRASAAPRPTPWSRLGGGAGRRLLRDQAAHRVAVLMAHADPPSATARRAARPRTRPVIVFDEVRLAFDEKVILERRQLHAEDRAHEDLPRRQRRRQVDDPAADPRPAQAGRGTIWVNGEQVDGMSEDEMMAVRADLGMVFQEGALFDSLTVRENVGYKLFEETAEAGRGRRARRGGPRLRRPRRVHRPDAVGAVGRPAAARGDRPGDDRQAARSCSTTSRRPGSIRSPR